MERTAYKKETYGWGDLRVLRKGASYTCVIHPEHMDAIYRQEPFTDEQGMRWQPEITDGLVTLTCGNYNFSIPLEQLNA
jgi:hypothetical protein